MSIFDTKVSTILNVQFIPVGINSTCSKVQENLIIVVMNFLFVIVAYSLLKNYSYWSSFSYKLDITVYVVATIFIFNTFWISRFQKRLLQKILGTITEDEKNAEFARLIRRYLKPLLIKVTSWHISALLLILILPVFAVCLDNSELGSPPTLLFPSWFPWLTRTPGQYTLSILLQLVSGSALYFIALTQEIVVVCFVAVLQAHATSFCRKVQEWDTGPHLEVMKARITKREYEDIVIKRFRKILSHFLGTHKFLKDVVTCSNPFATNSLFIFFDASILLTAMLVQKDNSFFYRLKMIAGELLGCTIFGVFCYLGDIINHVNDVFRDAVYSTSWYQKSPKLRKRVLIFMQLTQKSTRIRAFHMYTINIMFFARIIRLCFSLLQVLLKVQKE